MFMCLQFSFGAHRDGSVTRPYRIVFALAAILSAMQAPAQQSHLTLGPPPWHLRPNVRWGLQALASDFVAAHPDTSVHVTDGLASFDAATVLPEELGDVMFIPGAEFGQASILATLVARGLCMDLTDRVEAADFAKEDFYPNLWESVTSENRVWAVPLLVRSWGIAINTANIDTVWYAQSAQTWQGFLDCQANLVSDVDGDGFPDISSIQCGMSLYTLWQSVFLDLGGDPSNPQSFSPQSSAWSGATSYVNELLIANRLLFRVPRGPKAMIVRTGASVQFVHDDRGNRTSFQDRKDGSNDWQLFPIPGAGQIPPLDTTVLAIKRGTPLSEEAAWKFVAWVISAPVMTRLMPKYNMTPTRRSVVQSLNDPDLTFFGSQIERMKFQRPQAIANEAATSLRANLLATSADGGN